MSMQGGQGKERMGESMSGMMNMSASQLTMYLKNTDFPADKKKIVDMAKSNGAPENIIQMLNKLPDKQYSSSSDIEREFTKMR
jgi:hypothetical protein